MTIKKTIFYTLTWCFVLLFACKKDKSPKITIPQLTTTAISNISGNTATAGGTITSNGGETITASGVCWSTTNQNPTISDDTTKGNIGTGSFTVVLTDLSFSSKYYVRAYATNRNGTGYGEVVTFNTGNGAPVATNVTITGTPKGNEILTGEYDYTDPENDTEGGTTFQWYVADDATGTGEMAIAGATEQTFRVQDAQEGKYIRFAVTPVATTGSQNGIEVKSAFTTAVGEATSVTFSYNGEEVTYGIIVGPSGKKWLDRSLGAGRVAESASDYLAYGDLFQWGRLGDGHQRITRADGTDGGATGATGITSNTTDQDVPPTDKFITTTSLKGDWRIPQNSNLWQGVNGINNPCPEGWRIPTEAEWAAEGITNMAEGFTKLKLTNAGVRDLANGSFNSAGSSAWYWTSTVDPTDATYSIVALIDATSYFTFGNNRAYGFACRCIKD